jgi:IclR family pca regulon transcriptional regulator
MADDAAARDHVHSLERGLKVMEILAAHPAGLTLTEMAEKAGLTRAGARRFLLTLVATGYAMQIGRLFSLSPRLLSLTRLWLQGTSFWTLAEPLMREIAAKLQESCSATILSGQDVVYVARVAGPRIVNLELHVGSHLPAYCTAMGRALLSGQEPDEVEAFLSRASLISKTDKTVVEPKQLQDAIALARRDGFALVDEELEIGLRSIAVPLRDHSGAIVAAINVSTQTARHSVAEMKRDFLPLLKQTAARIEEFFVQ